MGFHELGIHFRNLFQGPFPGLQNTTASAAQRALEQSRPQIAPLVNHGPGPGQVSSVEVINHNNEMKEAQFLSLHYFFLKAFF